MTATVSHTRLRVLFALFASASLLLSTRLAYWQTVGRADLLSRATDQVHSDLAVAAQRGVIRDRSGAVLATTVDLRSLYAIPAQMKDDAGNETRSAVAVALAPILREKVEVLRAAFDSGAEWLFVRRRRRHGIRRTVWDPRSWTRRAVPAAGACKRPRIGAAWPKPSQSGGRSSLSG